MRFVFGLVIAAAIAATVAPFADAHFRLLEPQGWLVESALGDPQKLGPCGGTSKDGGMPTNIVGKATGGQKIHIKVQETVFHPGHYRIALALNSRAGLPADPTVVTQDGAKGPQSVSAPIQNPVQPPVLADGLFVHNAKSADPFETDVTLPNISCAKCTLQIVEFMAQHGLNPDGGYFYHHCAELQITADPSKPIDTRWK
jgi:hypothetical protein